MNSYTLIDKMRKARRANTISSGAQGLFSELVAINNEENWAEEFKCTASELCGALNVSEKTLNVYRIELMRARLVGYISGQSKRAPSTYCLFGSRFGTLISSNIYHQSEHQTEHQMVSKTPDLYKTKSKTKSKTKKEVVVVSARDAEIEAAIIDFTSGKPIAEEKEKNSAQKENVEDLPLYINEPKPFPTHDEAMTTIVDTAHWRNIVEHNGVTEEQRTEWFKIFYERHEDRNRISFPTKDAMASHYYYWTISYKNNPIIKSIQENANNKASTHVTGSSRAKAAAANQECDDIAAKSAEFLRRFSGD